MSSSGRGAPLLTTTEEYSSEPHYSDHLLAAIVDYQSEPHCSAYLHAPREDFSSGHNTPSLALPECTLVGHTAPGANVNRVKSSLSAVTPPCSPQPEITLDGYSAAPFLSLRPKSTLAGHSAPGVGVSRVKSSLACATPTLSRNLRVL